MEKTVQVKETGFFHIHQRSGAKIVEFAGYWMPVQYKGIMEEHRCVRTRVGLFDVSHMGEFIVTGEKGAEFLQRLTINDIGKIDDYQAQYTAMCYENGGIVDDLIIYKFPDHYMMVVNASNLDKDWQWAQEHLLPGVHLENASESISLLALQGPRADDVLQKLTDVKLSAVGYFHFCEGAVAGVTMTIARTGYTGEPGFELAFPVQYSEKVWTDIMAAGQEYGIEPVGLGARDTLRLEMKYCLYGNDIDATTNPLEAGLGWITKLDKGNFIGRDALVQVRTAGLTRKLVGFEVDGKAFPRHGYPLLKNGTVIGSVTSGTFSPMLEKSIGMGYVPIEYSTIGTAIDIDVRNRIVAARVVPTPFYNKRPSL
jgi:aminomethyltransferase